MSHFAHFLDRQKILKSPTVNQKTAIRAAEPLHPYYPLGVDIAGYEANESSVLTLLGVFSSLCVALFAITYVAGRRVRANISRGDLVTMMWFVLCGSLHVFFEGYFVLNFREMGSRQDLFGQLWKEYALSDSRYLTQNTFVLCMETITSLIWGPVSYLTAALIAIDSPYRYPFQAIISLGHLYGDVLYYATSIFDDVLLDRQYSRPEAYYFWGYYFLMNFFWIVVPLVLLTNSVKASASAFIALQKSEKVLKANGFAKKLQ
ncbi:EBDP4, emopamil-binding protein [Pseudovirgaria hyperparasitica]|uniref:EBDP4, emopamil-binding protein n=1 Tax=Pseudovirgaria hyperparasitica TaxID=470096 RepID=A0A6A6W427_9PEZI|nr:EBDP4, emopamil-binding protein [Pseudovirgaria hyperparasitica]KAF2756919.1 EBDP4, emopamil-binding protein [Pseudovirgaria hyperparasitica]